jgi:hypothetical protein
LWRTKSAVLHILVIELFELLEKWDDLNAERPFMELWTKVGDGVKG